MDGFKIVLAWIKILQRLISLQTKQNLSFIISSKNLKTLIKHLIDYLIELLIEILKKPFQDPLKKNSLFAPMFKIFWSGRIQIRNTDTVHI